MADVKRQVEILRHVPLFIGLNDRQLKSLAQILTIREYHDGDKIITQGKGGQGLFIVSKGTAKAIRTQPDGEDVEVNQFAPNDFFGELALLDDGVRTASVIATSEVQCLILTRLDFEGTLRGDPEMSIVILQELAKRFRRALESL
jgi:CRP/FNR family transcriptional regulator, cyclic AMP receptor protein